MKSFIALSCLPATGCSIEQSKEKAAQAASSSKSGDRAKIFKTIKEAKIHV
jgi:hypothetical protein